MYIMLCVYMHVCHGRQVLWSEDNCEPSLLPSTYASQRLNSGHWTSRHALYHVLLSAKSSCHFPVPLLWEQTCMVNVQDRTQGFGGNLYSLKSQTQKVYQEFCMVLWFNCDFFLAEQVVEWHWRRWGRQADPAACEAGLCLGWKAVVWVSEGITNLQPFVGLPSSDRTLRSQAPSGLTLGHDPMCWEIRVMIWIRVQAIAGFMVSSFLWWLSNVGKLKNCDLCFKNLTVLSLQTDTYQMPLAYFSVSGKNEVRNNNLSISPPSRRTFRVCYLRLLHPGQALDVWELVIWLSKPMAMIYASHWHVDLRTYRLKAFCPLNIINWYRGYFKEIRFWRTKGLVMGAGIVSARHWPSYFPDGSLQQIHEVHSWLDFIGEETEAQRF